MDAGVEGGLGVDGSRHGKIDTKSDLNRRGVRLIDRREVKLLGDVLFDELAIATQINNLGYNLQ